MTPEDASTLFQVAANNAILYGMGLIKMVNTPTGIIVEVVDPHEYLQMGEALKWAAEHMELPRTQ